MIIHRPFFDPFLRGVSQGWAPRLLGPWNGISEGRMATALLSLRLEVPVPRFSGSALSARLIPLSSLPAELLELWFVCPSNLELCSKTPFARAQHSTYLQTGTRPACSPGQTPGRNPLQVLPGQGWAQRKLLLCAAWPSTG